MSYKHKWPCRCSKCGARKTLNMMPHQYKLDKHRACLCGGELRVDWYRKKQENKAPCKCDGYHYPHRKGGGVWCKHHPTGPSEQDYLNRYGDYAEQQVDTMNDKLIKYQAAVFADAAEGEKLGYLCQLVQIYNVQAAKRYPDEVKSIAFTLNAGGWIFNPFGYDVPLFDSNSTLDQLISIVEGLLDELI